MSTPALLLVDVIRAFFQPSGIWWYPAAVDLLGPLEKLLAAARANDRLVVHAIERHHTGVRDLPLPRLTTHRLSEADARPMDGFELDPKRPAEILLPKHRYSAFFATDLDLLLRDQGVDTVIVAGVKTNVCVRGTVEDAFAYGYRVVVPREATNSNRQHLAEATIEDIEYYFGEVVHLDEALRRLSRTGCATG
jgi:maleamate amidohydrolase